MEKIVQLPILLMLCLVFSSARAQNSYTVSGTVVDATSLEPLGFSAVMLKGTQLSTEANAAGSFTIAVTDKQHTLVVFQYGYGTQEYVLKEGEEHVQLALKQKSYNLSEVVITSRKVDTLQARNRTTVLAFEFYDNLIVALVNKGKRHHVVQLLDESGNIVRERRAPAGAEELFRDCLGNIQLLSKDSSYQVYYNYETIEFLKPYPIAQFNVILRPCQCVAGANYYFKTISYKNLRNTYFMISKRDLMKRKLFIEVANTESIQAFNSDYDINYFLEQRRRGSGYAMSVDEIKERIEELRETLSLSPDYLFRLNPIQSGMMKLDSFILVADYTHRLLYRHNLLGGLLSVDTLGITPLSPFVVQDIDQKKTYFVQEINGSTSLYEYKKPLKEQRPRQVEGFRFLRNVRCRNGVLYFLNRNALSDNLTKIYTYKL